MDDTKRDTILRRVKKLLALSTSSNQHEAAAAAAKAQALLWEHKLAMTDVNITEPQTEGFVNKEVPVAKSVVVWKRTLGWVVALGFGCRAVSARKPARIFFLGRESDVAVAVHVYEFLTREIDRLADEAWARQRTQPLDMQVILPSARVWKGSFREGAVVGVRKRLEEDKEAMQAAPGMRALVLASDKAVNAFVNTQFTRLVATRSSSRARVSADAHAAGVVAGKNIAIRKGVTSAPAAARLT